MDDNLLSDGHKEYILKHCPDVWDLLKCIRDFRYIFTKRSMPRLHLFIEYYCNCHIPEIRTFAKGLLRDIDAVENAVASDFSNGFVEGTNSKLKMIKRAMYGRCSIKLLSAKMMIRIDDNG